MNRMRSLTSFLLGALFGIGLIVSGMIHPQKVQDFLDVSGQWDASLALVMGGALLVTALTFPLIVKRREPLLATKFHLPTAKEIDAKLIVGAALFGIGWGLGGFCPGPAIVGLLSGSTAPIVFVAAMIVGMVLQRVYHDMRNPTS
ncbi:MAG: YeeE/YedE family protein [Polyangia bacterium]